MQISMTLFQGERQVAEQLLIAANTPCIRMLPELFDQMEPGEFRQIQQNPLFCLDANDPFSLMGHLEAVLMVSQGDNPWKSVSQVSPYSSIPWDQFAVEVGKTYTIDLGVAGVVRSQSGIKTNRLLEIHFNFGGKPTPVLQAFGASEEPDTLAWITPSRVTVSGPLFEDNHFIGAYAPPLERTILAPEPDRGTLLVVSIAILVLGRGIERSGDVLSRRA
jgi:hypothetical protein